MPRRVAGVVGLLHAAGVAALFAPLEGLWNRAPVIEQDWGPHAFHLSAMREFWTGRGSLWGFHPGFMAGFPANTIQDASIKFFEFMALPWGGAGMTPVFKLTAFLSVALVPWFALWAAREFFSVLEEGKGGGAWVSATAMILATAAWWNSLAREMFFYGMLGFPAASWVAILMMGMIFRLVRRNEGRKLPWCALGFLAIALPALHLQGVALIAVWGVLAAGALALAKESGPSKWGAWVTLGGIAVVGLAVNWPWLGVYLRHRENDVAPALLVETGYFTSGDPLTFLKDYTSGEGYFTFRAGWLEKPGRVALLALGVLGLGRMWSTGRKSESLVLGLGVAGLFGFAYGGSLVPSLAGQQPLRFKVPLDAVLALCASFELGEGLDKGRGRFNPRTAGGVLRCAILGLGFAGFAVNLARTESAGAMRLRTELPGELVDVIAWADKEAPPESRILFEESGDESGFAHAGVYLSAFVRLGTGRELIGGPANVYNDRHHHAEFHSGRLFKRPLADWSDEELRRMFEDYNIGGVVVFNRKSGERLLACKGLVELDRQTGGRFLLRASRVTGWAKEGAADIRAEAGRIVCSNVRGPRLRLKYHRVEGMRARPELEIRGWTAGDDPIPMIEIHDPPDSFELLLP